MADGMIVVGDDGGRYTYPAGYWAVSERRVLTIYAPGVGPVGGFAEGHWTQWWATGHAGKSEPPHLGPDLTAVQDDK